MLESLERNTWLSLMTEFRALGESGNVGLRGEFWLAEGLADNGDEGWSNTGVS